VVPELNITLADAQKQGEVYTVRIPASAAEIVVRQGWIHLFAALRCFAGRQQLSMPSPM
jgi:hypothetical protein